jgi:CelD/BcsL family acetyltransferase involved in cellulose biosynthesis
MPANIPALRARAILTVMAETNVTLRQSKHRAGSAPLHEQRTAPVVTEGRCPDPHMPQPWVAQAAACWPGLTLQVHGDLAAVEREWRTFEQQADCTVFQAFDWLAKWQQHIGSRAGVAPAIVLGRDAGGSLAFILQLAVETGALARRLTWLGSDLCDYNAPLLAPGFSQHMPDGRFAALWREIVALLRSDRRLGFDLIDLQKMPEQIGTQRNPFLDLPVLVHPSGAYIATLGRDWDAFYAAKRSAATRKRERRQLKHLAEHGEVRFVDVEDRDDVARTLDTLLSQKSRSFARMGVRDIFARPGHREFFLDVATDLNVRSLTHISRLDVGAVPAAANLGLRFRNSYYLVLSSYHDGELSRFGPGRAHLHELLRHAIARGFERFDFTVGDEPYKRDWSDTELRLRDYLAAATMRGWLAAALMLAYRRTKRFIKQTPVLWNLFSKARSLAASIRSR